MVNNFVVDSDGSDLVQSARIDLTDRRRADPFEVHSQVAFGAEHHPCARAGDHRRTETDGGPTLVARCASDDQVPFGLIGTPRS